jgi:hypothetical protein
VFAFIGGNDLIYGSMWADLLRGDRGDKIDLSAMDAKALVKGDGSLLTGDTNGDGLADFSIAFHGTTTFSPTDFVL